MKLGELGNYSQIWERGGDKVAQGKKVKKKKEGNLKALSSKRE